MRKIELTSGNPGLFYVFSRTAISLDDHFGHSVSNTGKANDRRVRCHQGKMGSKGIHATRQELLAVNLTEEIRNTLVSKRTWPFFVRERFQQNVRGLNL